MGMKGKLMALAALAALGDDAMYGYGNGSNVEPDTDEQIATRKKAHIEVLMSKGLKWFNVDGVWIIALNKKNAERKAKKLES